MCANNILMHALRFMVALLCIALTRVCEAITMCYVMKLVGVTLLTLRSEPELESVLFTKASLLAGVGFPLGMSWGQSRGRGSDLSLRRFPADVNHSHEGPPPPSPPWEAQTPPGPALMLTYLGRCWPRFVCLYAYMHVCMYVFHSPGSFNLGEMWALGYEERNGSIQFRPPIMSPNQSQLPHNRLQKFMCLILFLFPVSHEPVSWHNPVVAAQRITPFVNLCLRPFFLPLSEGQERWSRDIKGVRVIKVWENSLETVHLKLRYFVWSPPWHFKMYIWTYILKKNIFRQFIWHIFWHSIWHSIWHIFWHGI